MNSYQELARKLTHLSERLQKHSGKLDGFSLGKRASKLDQELERFEAELNAFIASRKSGELALEMVLRSPTARKWLSIDILSRVAREVGGKRLKSETLPEAKAEFLESVHEAKEGEAATKHLRACLAEAIEVRSGGKDKLALQREFIQLGRLGDQEYALQISKRTFGELRKIAGATGIRFTDRTTKQRLVTIIRRYALRAAVNAPPVT
jgi:hypothetical protein